MRQIADLGPMSDQVCHFCMVEPKTDQTHGQRYSEQISHLYRMLTPPLRKWRTWRRPAGGRFRDYWLSMAAGASSGVVQSMSRHEALV